MKIRHGTLFVTSIDENYIIELVEKKMNGQIMDIQIGETCSVITCQSPEFDEVDVTGSVPKYWANLETFIPIRVNVNE